jgi:hypothetical protein
MLAKGRAEFQQGRDFSRVCSKNTGGSRKHESTIKARQMAAAREYFRFVRLSKQGRADAPRTTLLAVVVAVILALLGIVMAAYLILVGR